MTYGAVAASIIIAMSPVLFFSFGYHNDFNAWLYDSSLGPQPEMNVLFALGRYLGALGEDLQFLTIHSLAALWGWRLVAILSTVLLATYYLHIVSLRRPPTWQNACLSVAVFTLPTMQFQAVWVSMYVFWTPPILLSLAAAHLLLKATERDVIADRGSRRRSAVLTLLAFVLVLAGCFFYPISATFVLVPAAHLLLMENKQQVRQMAALTVPVLGSAFIALFVIHKFIVLPHLSNVPYLGEYGYNFSDSLITESLWRLGVYLRDGASLWLSLKFPIFQHVVALLFVVAAAVCAMRLLRGTIQTGVLINVLLACSLFIVAAAPLVLVQQFTATYRVMFTMTSIELLILFWLLTQFPFGALRLAALFAVLGVACAFVGVCGTAASNHADYLLFSKAVANLSPREFHSFTILRPNHERQIFGFPLDKDLGGLNPTDYIFDSLIGTRYDGKGSFDVTTLVIPPDSENNSDNTPQPAIEKNSIVIDTSAIYGLPAFRDIAHRFPVVSAQPRGLYGPANALDLRPGTAWEVVGTFPMALEVDYPTAHTLRGYSLSTVEATERMPSRWEIWVSSDLANWHRVQEMAEGQPWKPAETRHYELEPIPKVTGIKLVITGTDVPITGTDQESVLRLYEFTPLF